MRTFIFTLLALFALSAFATATAPGSYYVTADHLNVRLAPSAQGKLTNKLAHGSRVDVQEVRSGWARISKFYSGYSEGVNGKVARWVSARYLSKNKPQQETANAASGPLAAALSHSDDYAKHKAQFLAASRKLINQRKCSLGDFKEMGGWMHSSSAGSKPVYFTYCGGMRKQNRIYLNAATGKTYK